MNHGINGSESIADHMYRMALMSLIVGDLPGINRERFDLLSFCFFFSFRCCTFTKLVDKSYIFHSFSLLILIGVSKLQLCMTLQKVHD